MNKKGFTLVELITTFALASVVITLLINVVLLIKNIYTKSVIKTELLINQANLSNAINYEFNNNSLDFDYDGNYECDGCEQEYSLYFNNNAYSRRLIVEKNKIIFDKYVYEANEGTEILLGDVEVGNDGDFFVIKIPIKNKLYPDIDFGINMVYIKST